MLRIYKTWKLMDSVALVVLASDSLEAVIPRYTSDQWKLLCFIVYVHYHYFLRSDAFSSK
jgi:hypothetical protein